MGEMKNKTNKFHPFLSRMDAYPGQTGFETHYKHIQIIDKVEKVGEGVDDYIIKKVVVEDLTPIQEVINADANSVGVANIMKMFSQTQDESLLPRDDGSCHVDLVEAPETLMELKQMGQDAEKKFAALDPELTKGMDMAAFVNNLTHEQFDAFIKAATARAAGKQGGATNE